ncbi:solute carrier family 22 member 15-like [Gigantopelta aegis]|uniref:solute carrier family 22 member 15-like n=1 Tax=Gigantopelta aegis TaxID=1735272 RepID=UPI001B88A627|nr:solute carrier family 22 member 15-like [Gigantopelta aegis]
MATLEDLLAETGPFSRFQVLILVLTLSPKMLAGWSMLTMSFAGAVPEWWCLYDVPNGGNITRDNTTFQICQQNETAPCKTVYSYSIHTIINEWDLVCGNSWVKPAVTSIQMAGVLVGALLGGQSGDMIGRRYTLYISLLIHGVANVVAAYSVTWQMFAVLRFVLGFMIGSILVVSYTYPMEFIGVKERSVCSAIPNWPIGVSLFALTAWRLEDWSQLHLACAALHVIFLTGFFFVPESVRWLAVQNRTDEAEKVIYRMCSMNSVPRPDNCRAKLQALAKEESNKRESRGKYTYMEIVRGRTMIRRTVMIDCVWCFMSVIYYGLSFGVDKLSGNLYLNIFLMTFVEVPGVPFVMFLTNRLGRRRCCAGLFSLGLMGAIGVIVTHYGCKEYFYTECKIWGYGNNQIIEPIQLNFPRDIWRSDINKCVFIFRNLGYGAANTAARVGGIISPFLFTASNDIGIPFIVVALLFVVCVTFSLLLDETRGTPLQDTLVAGQPGDRQLWKKTIHVEAPHKPDKIETQNNAALEAIELSSEETKTVDRKTQPQSTIDWSPYNCEKIESGLGNTDYKESDVVKEVEKENSSIKMEDCSTKSNTTKKNATESKSDMNHTELSRNEDRQDDSHRTQHPETSGQRILSDSGGTVPNNKPVERSEPAEKYITTLYTTNLTQSSGHRKSHGQQDPCNQVSNVLFGMDMEHYYSHL